MIRITPTMPKARPLYSLQRKRGRMSGRCVGECNSFIEQIGVDFNVWIRRTDRDLAQRDGRPFCDTSYTPPPSSLQKYVAGVSRPH
jgi:hypothetical protein